MVHAQLDENNICIGYGDLKEVVYRPNLAYLPDGWDEDFLWRKHENGAWSTEKFLPPAPVPGPDLVAEINQLKAEKSALSQQISEINGNLAGFIDQYYIDNPDKA